MQGWTTLSELKQAGAEIPPKTLWESAEKAGILDRAQVQEILAFIQAAQQPPGMPPGAAPPPGAPPLPTPPPTT